MADFLGIIGNLIEKLNPVEIVKYPRDWWARWVSGAKNWPLEFEFDKRSNLRVSNGFREVRLRLWNRSKVWPICGLTVAFEALERLDGGPTNLSAQFTGMPLKIERLSEDHELAPDAKAEIWFVQHTQGEESLYFHCSESDKPLCNCQIGEYRARLVAAGKGISSTRASFRIAATAGNTMEFSPE